MVEEITSKISIYDVISSRVNLSKKGKEFQAPCPFHSEKTPSFTVSPEKGFYHCFGCGAHGNAIGFVMAFDNLSFKESIHKIANEYGIIIKSFGKQKSVEQANKEERQLDLLQKISQFFVINLKHHSGSQALEYIQKRHISEENIANFNIGFAPNDFNTLINFLQKNHFSEVEILKSGIIGKGDKGNLYSKFKNRLVFPIADKNNQIIAFGGRRLDEEIQPKYLNSSETDLFKKSQNLYNQHFARREAYKAKFILVTEGYMDVVSLFQHGIKNVVAPLGTAISKDQIDLLRQFSEKVIFCLDGDNAGLKAVERVIEIILPILDGKNFFNFVFLPKGLDPDDFVRNFGKGKMLQFCNEAKNLSEVIFDLTLKNCAAENLSSYSP
ncbi:DNA primase, partial [Flavobacteriaceae bacterium]|nr:DNA primase [Flavobacteriaceae bacterium]